MGFLEPVQNLLHRKILILTLSVVSIHLFVFFFDFKREKPSPPPKKSIVVHTFTQRPKPKKVKKMQPSRQTAQPKKASKKQNLLKELKHSLNKIESPSISEEETSLPLPKIIPSLQVDEVEEKKTPDYYILLAETLKEELELPEYGDVQLELTVLSNGRVSNIKVLRAASEQNRKYLELNLPKVSFPPFSKDLKNERKHTFTLMFCNESQPKKP